MRIKFKEYQKRLMEGVKQVLDSGEFQDFLAFTAKFRKYSFANTVLIWSQKPDATYVAGMKTWNSLGRKVKKGSKGIAIFAPMIGKKRRNEEEKSKEAEEEKTLVGFRAVYVWDVSQTEGDPLPEMKMGKIHGDRDGKALLEKILSSSPVPVTFEPLEDKRGAYFLKEKKIIVSMDLNPVEQCKTLFHELAHHLALSTVMKEDFSSEGRSSHEVLAEGAAYMACSSFGIDSSEYSFSYLAAWSQDLKKVFSCGEGMKKIATRLVEMVDGSDAPYAEVA